MSAIEHNHLYNRGNCRVATDSIRHSIANFGQINNKAVTVPQSQISNSTLGNHADIQWNGHQYLVDSNQGVTSFRTTFRVFDIDSKRQKLRKRFDQLWKLQTGRRHTWEDDNYRKTVVRNDATWKRCDAILQSLETPDWVRETALRRTVSTNIQGFSRYYSGSDGACVGFALVSMFDSTKDAKSSWIAYKAAEVVPGFDQDTIENLIDYTFDNYE